jgi:hypothetical protein
MTSSGPKDVHLAGADLHDEQGVDPAQRDGVEGEEVGGQQSGGLSAQEAPPSGVRPAWCWAESSGGQVPADRAGAYAVSEAEEFPLDPAVAQKGFSCARRSTRTLISSSIGGRPERWG